MPRYLITLAYDGTCYHGWQKQPDAQTVQGEVERVMQILTREEIELYASGRTDSGVHAETQYAHFHVGSPLDLMALKEKMGRMLSDAIQLLDIIEVPDAFHARYDAEWRQYRYQVLLKPNPFLRMYAWYPGKGINLSLLGECLKKIEGIHDFSGFSRKADELPHQRCHILKASYEEKKGNMIIIRIKANRFLRSMVRALTGAALSVAFSRKEPLWFDHQLKSGESLANVPLAPSKGLFLEEVFYPERVLRKADNDSKS